MSDITDITDLDADALSAALHARELSCREVMTATLARVDAVNAAFNAIVSRVDGEQLLRQADAHDAALARDGAMGWMHGMPIAVKDMSPTAGIPTTLGSPLLRDFMPREDGLMVQRLKAAGAIVIGKTNTPEFGLGSHTFNEVFGLTRNAWDPRMSAGGSSGGAAVALALRMLPVADGSDFMGSLRNPAGWNNVFGLRPSQGRVPSWPVPDVWVAQLGTEGPMGRTVRDVARLLDVQAGFDPRAPLSIHDGPPRFASALEGLDPQRSARGLRIGWLADLDGHLPMEDGVLDTCAQALKRLEGMGAIVEPVSSLGMPPERVWEAWLVWRRWLVAGRIAQFLVNPANRAHIKPEALWEHDQAQGLTGAQVMAASAQRTAFLQHMLALFERFDVLALPSAQCWPFEASLRWPKEIAGRSMDTYHRWMEVVIYATFAGLPAISVPAGFGEQGLPMGLQLIGRPQADGEVLKAAAAYEAAAQEVVARRPLPIVGA